MSQIISVSGVQRKPLDCRPINTSGVWSQDNDANLTVTRNSDEEDAMMLCSWVSQRDPANYPIGLGRGAADARGCWRKA